MRDRYGRYGRFPARDRRRVARAYDEYLRRLNPPHAALRGQEEARLAPAWTLVLVGVLAAVSWVLLGAFLWKFL